MLTALGAVVAVAFTAVTSWAAVQAIEVSRGQADEAVQHELTDRFTAAVGELGSDSEEARLGGIYALERIARDSERDQSVVVEVLCAYVRERAPRSAPSTAEGVISNPSRSPTPTPALGQLKTDVQAAVAVVARRELRNQNDVLDLSRSYLAGANLENLAGTDLKNGPFGARLRGASLEDADLAGANLQYADLRESNLKNAHLVGADLRGIFTKSNLTGADLTGAHMEAALFDKSTLNKAILAKAALNGADLNNAELIGTHLPGAVLGGAQLDKSRLIGADLTGAYLAGAHLPGAILTNADLNGADLAGADLTSADLTDVHNVTLKQLQVAHIDHSTTMPLGFRWTANGVQEVSVPDR